jgi:ketosteroid isomerase-like protein
MAADHRQGANMAPSRETLIELEMKFWQSIMDGDSDAAADMLTEPALMVSSHGAIQFDRNEYRKMAEQGPMVLSDFELTDMKVVFPNETTAILSYHVKQTVTPRGKEKGTTQEVNDTSTWVKNGDRWQCVAHTETPAAIGRAKH